MGRQKGQSQRTKGNVRPSSSSRAATLLAENQRFVGFDSMSGDLGYVPMLKSLEDDGDAHIDPDFRVVLNKMTKKDVTTKTKALNEFSELCQNKPVQDTIAILAYWPRIYNKLCDDGDRKVRECCQVAFNNLIVAVKKEIAPHLKSIMGCWWMAQSDSHAPTSTAALKAFKAAFPVVDKQKKALLFCQQEIIHSLSNTIFAKHVSSDFIDAVEQERKQSMALNAFASFLLAFGTEEICKISPDLIESICLNSRFWKIAKIKSPVVRAAFYFSLSTFCSHIPNLVTSQLTVMAKSILHKLDESNPLASKSVWEAANNLTNSFSQWHDHIDIRKGFLPQLWSLTRNGFYGNAKVIAPYFPKVISRFPASLAVLPVYKELFKCLEVCLQSEKVLKSPIEMKSIVSVIMECMDLVLEQAVTQRTLDSAEVIQLLWKENLFLMVKSSIQDTSHSFLSSFYKTFAQHLTYWSSQSKHNDIYTEICTVAWSDLLEIGKSVVTKTTDRENDQTVFLTYLNLLKAIHRSVCANKTVIQTQQKYVKFVEKTGETLFHTDDFSSSQLLSSTLLYKSLEFCVKECIQCLLKSELDESWTALVLCSLLKEFTSSTLFTLCYGSPVEKDIDYAFVFLEKTVLPWVRNVTWGENSKELSSNIGSIIYHVATACNDNSISSLFESVFLEFTLCSYGQICLHLSQLLIDDQHAFVTSDCDWFLNFILQVIERLGEQSSELNSQSWKLLQSLFSNRAVLKPEGALKLLEALNKLLEQRTIITHVIEVCSIYAACFATFSDCQVVMNVEKANFLPALFGLIRFLCNNPQDILIESLKNTMSTLLKTCYKSDSERSVEFVSNICTECAAFITSLLFKQNLDSASVKGFTKAIVVIAEELVMHHMRKNFVVEWLNALLPDIELWNNLRPPFDSAIWKNCYVTRHEFGSENAGKIVKDSYFLTVLTFADVAAELRIIFSEAYDNVAQHSKFRTLNFEILFTKAIFTTVADKDVNFSPFQPELYPQVWSQLLPNAVKIGNGWLILFTQFARSVSLEHWDDDFFMTSIFRDDPPLSTFLAQILTVFIEKSTSLPHLMTLVQWTLRKFLDYHLEVVETVSSSELTTEAFSVLVTLLRKVGNLQDNKPVILDGDESSLAVHIQLFEIMIEWKSSCPTLFLFDADLLETTDKQIRLNSVIVRFLHCVIDLYPFTLASNEWDFIQCSFVSWIETCSSLKETKNQLSHATFEFLFNVCNLMLSLDSFISSPVAISDPTLPSSLNSEWNEFFKPAAQASLMLVYKAFACGQSKQIQRILSVIGQCFKSVTSATLLTCAACFETSLMPGSFLPDELQTLLHHFCSNLTPSNSMEISTNQSIAFMLINKLLDQVFAEDISLESPIHLLQILDKVVSQVNAYMDSLESREESVPGKSKTRKSESDSSDANEDDATQGTAEKISNTFNAASENAYFYTYMLIWKLLINLINHCPSQKKSEYISILVNCPSININELLSNVTFMLPQSPYFLRNDSDSSKISMFTEELDFLGACTNSLKIKHLTCSLYKDLLRSFPVDVRLWFNGLSKNDRANITDYTSRHVTQTICREELDFISKCKPPQGLTVQVRKVAREVTAIYEISDTNFEVAVQLPANYPLSPVQVNTIQKVGVASSQWRYWMLQMTMLLQRQNGNILDAFLLWKQKVDKKLDGLEECMICFSIVHGTNARSLPKLQCKTCRKKYHAECLYKWFDTSNQSTCPLCRSPMMFR